MHPRAYHYIAKAVRSHNLSKAAVLELGSYNVNGSVRPLFDGCASYTGVDRRPGPDVDYVADAAQFGKATAYDVVVTTEVLEHAAEPQQIITNAHRVLKPGGRFLLTAAGPQRAPHSNDGQALAPGEHYQNIESADLASWLEAAGFSDYEIDVTADGEDIRATATKAAKSAKQKAVDAT